MLGVHHHQGAVLGPALAGVAGDGVGVVHRLHAAQVKLHTASGPLQLDPGPPGLEVQLADDAGVTIGDAEPLPLNPAPLWLLGLPVLDPVAHGEPPVFDPGDFGPPEPDRKELHLAATLQRHPNGLPLSVHPGDGPSRSLSDAVDLGTPLKGQAIPHLVTLDLLLLGLGQPPGDPDRSLIARLLNLAFLDQGLPDPAVQVPALLVAGRNDDAGLAPGRGQEVPHHRLVALGQIRMLNHLALGLKLGHRLPGPTL